MFFVAQNLPPNAGVKNWVVIEAFLWGDGMGLRLDGLIPITDSREPVFSSLCDLVANKDDLFLWTDNLHLQSFRSWQINAFEIFKIIRTKWE